MEFLVLLMQDLLLGCGNSKIKYSIRSVNSKYDWWYRSRVVIANNADGTADDGFLLHDYTAGIPASKAASVLDGLGQPTKILLLYIHMVRQLLKDNHRNQYLIDDLSNFPIMLLWKVDTRQYYADDDVLFILYLILLKKK